jgi:LysM repeat protein
VPPQEEWRRFAAPAAFLIAVTIAVILIRAGLESGAATTVAPPAAPVTTTHKVVDTVPATTQKSATTPSAAKQYWTVKAGDTFGVIASQSGVPVTTIEQLNPTVQSTALFIGEKIRVK